MKKQTPHIHKMKQRGLTLFCNCGYYFTIKCAHKWGFMEKNTISIDKIGGEIRQDRKIYFCSECGAIQHTNVTTGTTNITL